MRAKDIHHLEQALNSLQESTELCRLLCMAAERGSIRYLEAAESLCEPEEAVLAAWHWRLLIPSSPSSRTLAWEDAVVSFSPRTLYKMPPAVRRAVEQASRTGVWEPHQAVIESCPALRGQAARTVAELLRQMRLQAEEQRISAAALGGILKRLRLRGPLDQIILELKAAGVISPYLTSVMGTFTGKSPLYDQNPSLVRASA